jgi:hypothetical protein
VLRLVGNRYRSVADNSCWCFPRNQQQAVIPARRQVRTSAIFMRVKARYHPGVVKAEVVLVRAIGDGEGQDIPEGCFVDDPALGWAEHVSGPFHILDVAGAHLGMLIDEQCVAELSGKLNPLLERQTALDVQKSIPEAHAASR